jgi:hypothetical protein
MQAVALPASAGLQWINLGWYLFRRQPMALFSWAMFITLILLLATMLAPIGPMLFIVMIPCITFVTLSLSRVVHIGQKLTPALWIEPLKAPGLMRKLLVMGVIYVAICLLVGLIAFLPFAAGLSEAMRIVAESQDVDPLIQAMRTPMMIFVGLYVILAALFWYSPILVGWHSTSITQALFFSAIACWRNKWAFLTYGIAWAAIFFFVDLLVGLLVAMGISIDIAATLQVPVNILLGSVLYASFYPTYTSVFGQSDSINATA